jgi:hypothetical protein
MIDKGEVQHIVELARDALREEDAYLRELAETRPEIFGSVFPPGILRLYNERYYQCLTLRRLIKAYKYPVEVEKDTFDLVLYPSLATGQDRYVAVGEIKCWRAVQGLGDLPGIRKDFAKISRKDGERVK